MSCLNLKYDQFEQEWVEPFNTFNLTTKPPEMPLTTQDDQTTILNC